MSSPSITIDGEVYEAWVSASIEKSLDQFAHSWQVEFVDRWAPDGLPWQILPGNEAIFFVGDDAVVTGRVTRTNWRADGNDYSCVAQGRSETADLVDCSPLFSQVTNLTLGKLAEKICKDFGITVFDESGDDVPLKKFVVDFGESCFDLIDKACRARGVLPFTTSEGALRLARGDQFTRKVSLTEDMLVSRELEYSEDSRFSEYYTYGQHPGEEKYRADRVVSRSGYAQDLTLNRYRPIVIVSDAPSTQETLQSEAEWVRSVRAGRAETVRYRVAGAVAPDGVPWEPGCLAEVTDSILRVQSTLVVQSMTTTWDNTGVWTDLSLTRPEAYTRSPVPGRDAGGAW